MALLITHAPGIYRRLDGAIFRVQFTKNFDKVYSVQLVGSKWTYAPAEIATLDATMLLTLDEARAISRELGQCLACGSMLRDEKSLAAGIGPSCAKAWTTKPRREYRIVTAAKIDEARVHCGAAF